MHDRTAVAAQTAPGRSPGPAFVYRYDGTFTGFLCCVAQCFFDKRLPLAIQELDDPRETLFPVRAVAGDEALARRIERSVRERISPEAWHMTRCAFLSCMEEKEMTMLRFLLLGYRYGARVVQLTTREEVCRMDKALRFLQNEARYHTEFLRFSDAGGVLVSEITPKNNVLPLIVSHFCDRFSGEDLMIYDKTHRLGFYYRKTGKRGFFEADSLELPPVTEEEQQYRALWRKFYDSVAVEGRIDPRLRRNLMPMRYWPNMTEFQT